MPCFQLFRFFGGLDWNNDVLSPNDNLHVLIVPIMPMMKKIPTDRLVLETRFSDRTIQNFSRPDRIDWPESWHELNDLLQKLKNCLPENLISLVYLSLAAHFLLTPPDSTNSKARQMFIDTIHPDLLPRAVCCETGKWRLVPVIVVPHENRARIHWFMVGALADSCGVNWPKWMEAHLDDASLSAISDAFQAAREYSGLNKRQFTFPLMSPYDVWQIHGRSLGLPLALACLSALTGENLMPQLLSTGYVMCFAPFPIHAVADIPAKAEVARQRYRLLLVPKAGLPLAAQPDGLTIKSVGDLKEAWLWARLYSPGLEKEMDLLNHIQRDAALLVNNCLEIDRDLLGWLIDSENGSSLIQNILSDPGCVKILVGKLTACLESANRDLNRAGILGRFITNDVGFNSLGERHPVLAFKWSVLNLKRANHCGNNDESRYWKEKAYAFRQIALRADPKEYSYFINNLCVSSNNTYTFHPDPPSEFLEAMEDEQNHSRGLCYVLGSMYGTMAQNYAFCGPTYLKHVIRYIDLAQTQFGDGGIPDYRKEWIREFSYLIYAFLDASDYGMARHALWRYLQIDTWSELQPWHEMKNDYERFALVRYLADSYCHLNTPVENELVTRLIDDDACKPLKVGHPCQLIAWNLGKLALELNNPALANNFLETSIHFCEKSEETIRPMVLLPLSALYHANLLTNRHRMYFESARELIRSSQFLNLDHFLPLMAGDMRAVLQLLWKNQSRFFPFMYR